MVSGTPPASEAVPGPTTGRPPADDPAPVADPAPAASPSPAAAPAAAASEGTPAEQRGKSERRRGGLRARVEADRAAAGAQRRQMLVRRLPTLLTVVAALALIGWAARPLALRAIGRRDPGGDWGTWAVERLAELRDAGSFDLYVRELGRPEADHALYHRLVFMLGGRSALPEHEDGELLPEDPEAAAAHAVVLSEGLEGDDAVMRRGSLRAMWALKERPWARSDALLVAATDGLTSDDVVTRRYAAMVLKATPSHPAVQDALLRALASDPDAVVRKNAVQALGHAGDPARAPAVLAAVEDIDPEVRREAVLALARLGTPPPLERLEELLRGDDARRAEVLEAVARHDGARATRLLLEGLRDPAVATRSAAVAALSTRPEDEAREGLVGALRDTAAEVRAAAAAALARRGDGRSAVPAIVAALPRHESWGELDQLHQALRALTGAEIAGPGPDRESWARVVSEWEQWLERGGRAP